ncbi:TPA: recombination protein NinG [Yersinia enterocolitica]|uniref:recombination protein NinG n=1 Tax=Yersinia enterocolitica TaxID=630 RepID=UPI0028BB73AD|nr:recombination protein NinG [Yersinia enterocolitica]HDL6593752.1 recombination protein NinG [Yersinia enterocolitica]HDL7029539.1 recombination protein NinG [Yersinia enterocolitica]HDL7593869.1 recombination protein NinG [Yersinia enterocolitica]HDL8133262.1 recombination protein NinG [Yersinia enterocolitica]
MINKLPSHRNCKVCKTRFKPETVYQWWCNEEHRIEYAVLVMKDKRSRDQASELKRRREKEREEKKELKVRKINAKPKTYWIKQAQQAVNAFVRARDSSLPCVSCGTHSAAQWDAGHYRTTAAAPQFRFDPRQIHKQCSVCNQHKSGNIVPYRVELIKRIGIETVEAIENNHERRSYTVEELKGIRDYYRLELKQLKETQEAA